METGEAQNTPVRFIPVTTGEETSRLSSVAFFLLCTIPCLSAVLFGGVDNGTWILISAISLIVFLIWLAEEWNADAFLINTSAPQLSIIGLILIGIIQVMPLGSDVSAGVLAVPVAKTLSLEPYATRLFLAELVLYLVFFAACLVFINNERRLKKAVWLLVIFGALMAFFGILQRIANTDGIYGLRATPQAIPFGPFVNQHHFAAIMEMTGGGAIALLVGRSTGRDKRLLLGIAVSLMGVALVLTSSRGGMIGAAAVVTFILVLKVFSRKKSGRAVEASADRSDPKAKIIMAVSAAALILVVVGTVILVGGGDSLLRGVGIGGVQSDISNGRAHFWPVALKIFLAHPILGAGLDAFGTAYTKYDTWNGTFRVEQAHNEYLQTLADAGVVGFFCITSYIYFLFRKGLAVIAETSEGFRRNAAIGALAGCFGVLVHSFFDFPLRTPSNAFFFLLLSVVATVALKPDERSHGQRHHK